MDKTKPEAPAFIPPACAFNGPLRKESPLEKLFQRKKRKDDDKTAPTQHKE